MRQYQIKPFIRTLLIILTCQFHIAEGISRCNQHTIAAASIPRYAGSYRQSSLLTSSRRTSGSRYGNHYTLDPLQRTLPAARTRKRSKDKTYSKTPEADPSSEDPFAKPMTTQQIYTSLGPVGKVVAGTVEVAVSTAMEYITGFLGGYFLGTITDLPRFVFKGIDKEQGLPFMQELSQRYGRMHGKSFRWAKTWGGISAAFGGFRVATRVVRGGKEDEWNTIISSAAAGAFFARTEGPQAMLRGALTYGGMMYLFSGGLGAKKEPFQYKDQPLDF